jgi:hypothetical protein
VIHSSPIHACKSLFSKIIRRFFERGLYNTISLIFLWVLYKVENYLISRSSKFKDHLKLMDLSEVVKKSIRISPRISKSGFVYHFTENDIDKLLEHQFDILLLCSGGILRGEILNAARFGVLSLHHADNGVNRGVPAGFWEVYYKQDKTGFIIQQLTQELDGGNVIKRGYFQTQYHFLLNQASIYEKSNIHLMHLIKWIAENESLPAFEHQTPYSFPLYKSPTPFQILQYFYDLSLRLIYSGLRLFFNIRDDYWEVSYVSSDWSSAVLWRSTSIKNPDGHYLADPFVISKNGRHYCFVEDYIYSSNKGHISVYELFRDESKYLGPALIESFHLSFPFLFEFLGDLYMCPESYENHDIRIYKCKNFPLDWELSKIIMKDVSAVDTMLFEKNGKWWLLTNLDLSGTGEDFSELYLYHAESPLSEIWTPNRNNPVRVDSEFARNGGLLRDGKTVYRVGQSQGFSRYGKSSNILEIKEISEDRYCEELIAKVQPKFKPGIKGTHHIHSNGYVTVFDHVRNLRLSKLKHLSPP